MHIGFSFMNTPLDPSPVELAKALEERGFESLWTGEHSHIPTAQLSPYPAGGELPAPYRLMGDPYVALTAAAGATTQLKLGTGIALVMERDVFSQAKTMASLDRFSNGRLMVGTGVGWNREEFENVNPHPWDKRYSIMRETVDAMRTIWRNEEAEYHGDYIDFDPVWCSPKPVQENGPPIVFGAMGPLGIRHTAQWADGWMPVDIGLEAMGVSTALDSFWQQVEGFGRQRSDVSVTLQTMITPGLDKLKEYRDLGIERIIVGVAVDRWDQQDQTMTMIDEFAGYIPQLSA